MATVAELSEVFLAVSRLVAVQLKGFEVKSLVLAMAGMEPLDFVAVQLLVLVAVLVVDLAVVPVLVADQSYRQSPWLSFPIDFRLLI